MPRCKKRTTKKKENASMDADNQLGVDAINRHKNLSVEEKKVVLNARQYFEGIRDGKIECKPSQVIKNTAICTGYSERTIKRITSQVDSELNAQPPPPRTSTGRTRIFLDEFLKGVIRRKVHSFYIRKLHPTITDIHRELKADVEDFPDMSDSTLLRNLQNMGFRFKKFNTKSVCFESPKISDQRQKYLRTIRTLRRQGYKIYYTDETWAGANHTKKFGWQEDVSKQDSTELDFDKTRIQNMNGWKGGIIVPSGAGRRVIICDIGNEDGFIDPHEETMLVFEGKKDSSDYHSEMNAQHYCEWFSRVLHVIPNKSAVVIDRAPYHTAQNPETRNPSLSWKKDDIIDWLIRNHCEPPIGEDGIPVLFEQFTKSELIKMGTHKFKAHEYLLEKIIRESGKDVKLIWTPVAHCELNAIELVWAWVKGQVAKHNITFKVKEVEKLVKNTLLEMPVSIWKNAVSHVQKIEEEYWIKEKLLEAEVEIVTVQLGSDSSSISSDSDFESDD
ncbi:hypothetical protein B566_EDAN017391 [Ephemera danica]|nr:hypothetical protein B566_EDAN017391 [Ephemera danica]